MHLRTKCSLIPFCSIPPLRRKKSAKHHFPERFRTLPKSPPPSVLSSAHHKLRSHLSKIKHSLEGNSWRFLELQSLVLPIPDQVRNSETRPRVSHKFINVTPYSWLLMATHGFSAQVGNPFARLSTLYCYGTDGMLWGFWVKSVTLHFRYNYHFH
ncbi:hypothetical protein CEXT_443121 [Caerostris extrusa]|uniref:Uncharacterized protein n=1 Tax=Caerostris extrusa TaxID=172846 RepID=A0AAV4NNZ9_CAEEX|nr:hypothetical protein CEXT_443121 [Caerostris extrusa]